MLNPPVVLAAPEDEPTYTLSVPVVETAPAARPRYVLLELVFRFPALVPKKVLLTELVMADPDPLPTQVLLKPVLKAVPADAPMRVLSVPVTAADPLEVPKRVLLLTWSSFPARTLLVLKLRLMLSVVPIKLVDPFVPLFPDMVQSLDAPGREVGVQVKVPALYCKTCPFAGGVDEMEKP